jgi:anti-sigma factor RsiW
MTCADVELKLASYVEDPQDAAIAAHLATCASCRASAHAQTVARAVLRARADELAPMAPPGLRTRIAANQAPPRRLEDIRWSGRLSAFAAAAVVVLTLGAVLLPVATVRSTALLAAQLALDHLKCFTIEGDADGAPISKPDAEALLRDEYGLAVTVPPSSSERHLDLMAVRRCLYGDGRAAHLMYRMNGEPVSLFVIPGLARPADDLSLFGHEQVVWTQGDRTYVLIGRGGLRDDLARIAPYLRTEAK